MTAGSLNIQQPAHSLQFVSRFENSVVRKALLLVHWSRFISKLSQCLPQYPHPPCLVCTYPSTFLKAFLTIHAIIRH